LRGFVYNPPVSLEDHLPVYDINEIHSIRVAAEPEAVLAAVRDLSSREVPLVLVLMALRGLPAAIMRGRDGWTRLDRVIDLPLLQQFAKAGFVVLTERPDELVLGVVGRFWTLDGGIREIAPDEFVTFREPGFAKGAVNFHVRRVTGGTELTTETRVEATDEDSRRKFRRYWRIVMPGSALIRRAWLRAIRRRAERA
jgi:hypothetical protein